MKRFKNLLLVTFCAFAALVIFAGCNNDGAGLPVTPVEPTLTIKKVEGLTLFRDGVVVAVVDKETVQGVVAAQMGENADIFEVEFLDENGEVINGESGQNKLSWRINQEYATIEPHTEWEFCIFGNRSGDSSFELLLENGSGVEYDSPSIPLKVK